MGAKEQVCPALPLLRRKVGVDLAEELVPESLAGSGCNGAAVAGLCGQFANMAAHSPDIVHPNLVGTVVTDRQVQDDGFATHTWGPLTKFVSQDRVKAR